jgi:colanic acid biosynthesis glycosyl transferase WcaI
MRILLLTQYYAPEVGAPQVRLRAVVNEFTRRGHEVEVITAFPSYPVGRVFDGYRRRLLMSEEIDGIRVLRSWTYASQGRGIKRLLGYLSFTITSVASLFRARKPDLIFIESPPLFLTVPGLLYARLRRCQSVVNVADLWPDAAIDVGALKADSRFARLAGRLERWAYRQATTVNAVTEGIGRELADGRVDPESIRFFPNGVDTEAFRPDAGDPALVESLGLPSDKLVVYTGNIGLSQGLASVVRAMELVSERDPDVVLGLIGDGSDRPAMQELTSELGIDNVRFIDPVAPEMIARILPVASAAIVSLADLPTNVDARPSKIFPAMASACPIVFAGLSEGSRLVVRAGAGVEVANGDLKAIADAVLVYVGDHDRAAIDGAAGRAFVEAEMSWTAIVGDWLATLDW